MQLESTAVSVSQNPVSDRLTIKNKRGLHARASAKFVQLVDQFDAAVTVSKDGQSVCGNSIMGLMMLAAAPGCCIDVVASGSDAKDVLDAISSLIDDRFGEGE
ncbi:HPr family phosphocarrier protein [Cohaesibacter celericrescens]|uniref:HPr family phosphocarrier protein n=1 Tax=Cohaesibacter celericrescens TaxID=2067669 RepID=A0A2N5XUP1_9HYPH|nr:HPr family phosphocarrier protein [Cohaesibacter celericrescens]